ncbi:MAG: hypothetical protein MT490_18625 [Sphingomonas sp.]|uniref:hypothetical protein n=1 Tax=Sphingomonas sp. TaxID=28214 RepID=UPI0022758179|nr:hypothetical protein [Sphingomonas sp.]MCX8477806.1 hypothetical protein [Sphingomonas sp.]
MSRCGRSSFENSDLSIGAEGDGGLSLVRNFSYSDPYDSTLQGFGRFFTHNWDISLGLRRTPAVGACYPSQYDYAVSVNYAGLGEGFHSTYSPVAFQQTAPSGYAELTYTGNPATTGVYSFTARDGTQVVFRALSGSGCLGVEKCAYLSCRGKFPDPGLS